MSSFYRELKRRNVVKVGVAYAVVGWIVVEIASVVLPALLAPDWVHRVVTFLVILGLPPALMFAWAFELTPEGLKLEKNVDRAKSVTTQTSRKLDYVIIALLVVGLATTLTLHFSGDKESGEAETISVTDDPTVKSIAVLPFVNMSDDEGNEYFSDGIAEELLNVLVKVKGLEVASRTSSFRFKGSNLSIPEIADELNVNHVLEGSVRKAGNQVRVVKEAHVETGVNDL